VPAAEPSQPAIGRAQIEAAERALVIDSGPSRHVGVLALSTRRGQRWLIEDRMTTIAKRQ
jgi:hypothetical protein